jgi:hypothetical protein
VAAVFSSRFFSNKRGAPTLISVRALRSATVGATTD